MKRNLSKIKQKKAELEVLEKLFEILNRDEEDAFQRYEKVGVEQQKDWRTGELKWEDEDCTIPKMTDKYDYVPIKESEMSDEEYAKYMAISAVKAVLEKMV